MPQVKCPNGHRLQVPDRAIGQTISCPSCQASFTVEGAPEPSAFDLGSDEKRPAISGGGKTMPGGFTIPSLINCFVGRPLLFFGLILVVLGRGCDATSMRSVGRSTAAYNMEREKLRLEWDAKAADIRQDLAKKNREINEMFDGEKGGKIGPGDPDFQNKLSALQKQQAELNKKLNRMREDQNSAEAEKEAKEWKPLRAAYIQGHSNHQMSVYWFEWIFIFGTIILVLGMLTLAFTGQGAEKWVAYIMIAILTFSIYVGGAAWFESVASSFDRSGPPIFRDREIIRDKF